MSEWIIRSITTDDYLEESARVIRLAFADVARDLSLTQLNCPTSPAFETAKRLRDKRKKGMRCFGMFEGDKQTGFVAAERATPDLYYLERLAVIPGKRHEGRGRALVDFVLHYASSRGASRVSAGTFANDSRLTDWYLSLGFRETERTTVEGLPFDVSFMEIQVEPAPQGD